MVPSDNIAEAYAEGIVPVHSLYELSHVVRLLRKLRKLASLADLRVGNDYQIVPAVILRILLNYEIISFCLVIEFLVEEGPALERR